MSKGKGGVFVSERLLVGSSGRRWRKHESRAKGGRLCFPSILLKNELFFLGGI